MEIVVVESWGSNFFLLLRCSVVSRAVSKIEIDIVVVVICVFIIVVIAALSVILAGRNVLVVLSGINLGISGGGLSRSFLLYSRRCSRSRC